MAFLGLALRLFTQRPTDGGGGGAPSTTGQPLGLLLLLTKAS